MAKILTGFLALAVGCAGFGGARQGLPTTPAAPVAPGSHITPQVEVAVRATLYGKHYTTCNVENIKLSELLEVQPASIQAKAVLDAGDTWTERWKIDVCGEEKVHALGFEMVDIQGLIAVSMDIKPAEG